MDVPAHQFSARWFYLHLRPVLSVKSQNQRPEHFRLQVSTSDLQKSRRIESSENRRGGQTTTSYRSHFHRDVLCAQAIEAAYPFSLCLIPPTLLVALLPCAAGGRSSPSYRSSSTVISHSQC